MYLTMRTGEDIDIGYWRKANAIHNWFVENVQEGEDNCQEYEVSREKMEELLDTVNKVLASTTLIDGEIQNGQRLEDGKWVPIMQKGMLLENAELAQVLLPTVSGFFFGGTDYNQFYYEDLIQTREILVKALAQPKELKFYYQSSW